MIYDPFQKKAIDYIKEGHSVIVSAPTGAGKTVIAEYVINDCLAKERRVIYTAPIKALSNQKYRDFQKPFKDKIGILTGDVSINPHAPVLIMTTEIFRNKILEGASDIGDYSWIIFDEVHYLDDYDRGTVWEESLIFLPDHMNMLALSATIPNIDQLAGWLSSIHKKPIKVIKEANRPVPLHFFYQFGQDIFDDLSKVREERYWKRPSKPTSLIKHLANKDRLPCIYFCFSRKRCEYLAEEMINFDFLNPDEKKKLKLLYDELCARFDIAHERSVAEIRPLIEKGIAFHHAGMLPTLKEVVEQLFTSRLIKAIFTTETFALGINMPARTVIFDELRKYSGRNFGTLKTRDFYQMAGRAGRRGIDKEGFVYSRVNPRYTSMRELKNVIYGHPERVTSRFNASYATLLNLYKKHGERLYDIYPSSFHSFQQREHLRRRIKKLLHSKVKLLRELNLIDHKGLTEKGDFASKVYGYELPLTELYGRGVLEKLSETELGILALSLVFDPRKGTRRPKLTKSARNIQRITDEIIHRIHKKERKLAITPLSKTCYYHFTPSIEAWMRQERFDRVLYYTGADEGEMIRYFRMSIQILREILDTHAPDGLKSKTRKAIDLINRDIIDAEKQLRE